MEMNDSNKLINRVTTSNTIGSLSSLEIHRQGRQTVSNRFAGADINKSCGLCKHDFEFFHKVVGDLDMEGDLYMTDSLE